MEGAIDKNRLIWPGLQIGKGPASSQGARALGWRPRFHMDRELRMIMIIGLVRNDREN
jgi:hypothetical protein